VRWETSSSPCSFPCEAATRLTMSSGRCGPTRRNARAACACPPSCREHLARFGRTELGLLLQKRFALPAAVTPWHREWESVTGATTCLVAFIWCHA
jgi:hypothetical protein